MNTIKMSNFENNLENMYIYFQKKFKECKFQYEKIKLKNEYISILNYYLNKKYIDENIKFKYENKINQFLENI